MDWFWLFFMSSFWDGLTAIALIITLSFVIWYTISTHSIAKTQREEIGLQRRPVVSFINRNSNSIYFKTKIFNYSPVHAKYLVKVTIKFDGKLLDLPEIHHYKGKRIWNIQANTGIDGHLDLEKVLEYNNINPIPTNPTNTKVMVESWCINFYDSDSGLFDSKNKNPDLEWYWNGRVWIPEVDPD